MAYCYQFGGVCPAPHPLSGILLSVWRSLPCSTSIIWHTVISLAEPALLHIHYLAYCYQFGGACPAPHPLSGILLSVWRSLPCSTFIIWHTVISLVCLLNHFYCTKYDIVLSFKWPYWQKSDIKKLSYFITPH